MHSGKQITNCNLQQFKVLTNEDLQSNSNNSDSFSDAVILVPTNRERTDVNHVKIKQYAIQHNLPITRWLRKIKSWKTNHKSV